jgi:hypothetical protein
MTPVADIDYGAEFAATLIAHPIDFSYEELVSPANSDETHRQTKSRSSSYQW